MDGTNDSVFLQRFELARIAIGSMVRRVRCQLVYNEKISQMVLIFGQPPGKGRRRKRSPPKLEIIPIPLTDSSFVSAKFSGAGSGENRLSFVSMSIQPEPGDQLSTYRSYQPKSMDNSKKYIVLEFKSWEKAAELETDLVDDLGFRDRIASAVSDDDVQEYSQSLILDQKRQNTRKREPRNPYKGEKDDKILLVYPFPGDKGKIEAAAAGLKEASGAPLLEEDDASDEIGAQAVATDNSDSTNIVEGTNNDSSNSTDNKSDDQSKVRRRKHFVTLRVEDYQRLDPGEWLNDSLVDFWMQW
jgi:hypothetical protein